MKVCQSGCTEGTPCYSTKSSSSGCCSICCSEKNTGDLSTVPAKNSFDSNSIADCKLTKSNILDKLHLKLNQLNKLNARVQKCNEVLENPTVKCSTNSFQSKADFEKFLKDTYNDSRYSYCILNCGPSVPHRQIKASQIKTNRIPSNMGWNWKVTHSENWQPGALPKIIKMRMSHFLNYYPCDTLPISRLNIKLSKTSFDDCDNRESKIKKMIHSMGFSPCTCTKSIAWCMCRDKNEMNKLKNILQQIEKQIGESGLEYKLYLNDVARENSKRMSLFDKRTKAAPDLICQETQYEPMDFKILRSVEMKTLNPRNIRTTSFAKPNTSAVTVPEDNSKSLKGKRTGK